MTAAVVALAAIATQKPGPANWGRAAAIIAILAAAIALTRAAVWLIDHHQHPHQPPSGQRDPAETDEPDPRDTN